MSATRISACDSPTTSARARPASSARSGSFSTKSVAREMFEGSSTYRIKGTNQYLTLIEAANENWTRYFKAFIADGLDGEWRPLAAEWGNSFADDTRVRSHDGKPLWTKGISHGELLRDGHNQTNTIDPAKLSLLYQGLRPDWDPNLSYLRLPYQ